MSKEPQKTAQKTPAKLSAKKERASTTAKKSAMLAALAKTYGVVTSALSLLADPKREGGPIEIGSRTYYDWLKADTEFAADVLALADRRLDLGEASLMRLVGGYEVTEQRVVMTTEVTTTTSIDPETKKAVRNVRRVTRPEVVNIKKVVGPEPRSVEFLLETQGRARGYDKKITVKVPGLSKLKVIKHVTKPHRNPGESTLTVTKSPRSAA